MLTQVASFQIGRLWLVALAAFALAAFVAFATMPRVQLTAVSASAPVPSVQIQPTAEPIACGHGAYVTGDMAGEASPTSVYAALCGPR